MEFLSLKNYKNAKVAENIACDIKIINIDKKDGPARHAAATGLRYFVRPNFLQYQINLSVGYEDNSYNRSEVGDNEKNSMQNFIKRELKEPNGKQLFTGIDVCTSVGILHYIMMMPFHLKNEDFEIKASKFGGKIYLNYKTKPRLRSSSNFSQRHFQQFKFRQYCFADSPNGEPNPNIVIDQDKEFNAIFCAKLENLNILYSGGLAGVKNDVEISDLSDRQQLSECQVVLTRVVPGYPEMWLDSSRSFDVMNMARLDCSNDIYVAFVNYNGIVHKPIMHYTIEELSKYHSYTVDDCLEFLHKFLSQLRSVMADVDCPFTTFVFKYNVKDEVVQYHIVKGKSELSFLTKEFIDCWNQYHN